MELEKCCFTISLGLNLLSLTYASVMNGMYEEVSGFVGLSLHGQDITKIRCSTRCLRETCRGIQFEASTCKLLFDTNDVPQNERTKYNQVDLSGGDSDVLINVLHQCSSVNTCHHGGVCEAVDGTFQCNCDGTAHHGPVCETAGNAWTAQDGWNTLYPQLNLNLDDQTPYSLYNGATHVATENSYGFQMDGGSKYVDLGNWLTETCFVDVDTCQEGFTLMAYVNIATATNNNYLGYISSMTESGIKYGAVVYGYSGQIRHSQFIHYMNNRYFKDLLTVIIYVRFEVVTSDAKRYFVAAGGLTFPTGWISLVVIYKVNDGIQVYVDNDLKAETSLSSFLEANDPTTITSGHIVLGRRLVNDASHSLS